MISDERKAIVKYLREVAKMYEEPVLRDAEGGEYRGEVFEVLDVCIQDIEEQIHDTLPEKSEP